MFHFLYVISVDKRWISAISSCSLFIQRELICQQEFQVKMGTFIPQGQYLNDLFPVTITTIQEFLDVALTHAFQTFDNCNLEVAACHFKQL